MNAIVLLFTCNIIVFSLCNCNIFLYTSMYSCSKQRIMENQDPQWDQSKHQNVPESTINHCIK
ncbi:hypothetical protein L9F63_024708, partial [Diploptera punctata]